MNLIYLVLSVLCCSVHSADTSIEIDEKYKSFEPVPVDIHPLLENQHVQITLSFDPSNIPPELSHLLQFMRANGAQCEVKHDSSEVVASVWGAISEPSQDYSYLYNQSDKPFRILSLDGGGIRGLMTCIFLSHLTHITRKPVHELFDMIVATSTGTLIAAGLATKKGKGADAIQSDFSQLPYKDSIPSDYYTPEDLASLYLISGKEIFSGAAWWGQWNGPKYSDVGLNTVLLKYFKDELLSDLGIPVVLTAYDLHKRTLHPFCSFGIHESKGIFVREALRACVAAPSFFTPSMVLKEIFCDGGIVKNNPASLGIAVAAREYKTDPRKVELLSLGCGHSVDAKNLSVYQAMGIRGWADELLSGILDGQADHDVIQILHQSGVGPRSYVRVSPLMETVFMGTDDTTPANFGGLLKSAISEINRRYKDFLRFAKRLTGEEPKDLRPDSGALKIKVAPLSVSSTTTESAPVLPGVTHPLIQQSVSLPVLPSVGQPQRPQTEQEVLDGGSALPAQERGQQAS